MEVTDIRVRKVNKEGKMKAVVSVTFDNEIVIHDIKVIEREEGLFIAMPSRRKYRNLCLKNTKPHSLKKRLLKENTTWNK